MSTNSINGSASRLGTRTRRHPQVSPHVLTLLHRAQHGDRDAFADLYRTFHDAVTRYVAVRMRDRDRDAIPDLVQDAFTGALEELPQALLDVRGWFIIQAAKACTRHDWSRRRYTRAAYTLREHATRGTTSPGLGESHSRPRRVAFVHAMAPLTPDQRRAIQLRYLDGYPRDAAARLMDRSIEAVRRPERGRTARHCRLHRKRDTSMRKLWALPFTLRQINDANPGHEGPSCQACAAYQADRQLRAEQTPMLHDLRNRLHKSPHAGTYLYQARYSRWACTQGAHGPLDEYASLREHPGGMK